MGKSAAKSAVTKNRNNKSIAGKVGTQTKGKGGGARSSTPAATAKKAVKAASKTKPGGKVRTAAE